MHAVKGKQLENTFLRKKGFLKEEHFEKRVKELLNSFRTRYQNVIIEEKRNKCGIQILIYEKITTK